MAEAKDACKGVDKAAPTVEQQDRILNVTEQSLKMIKSLINRVEKVETENALLKGRVERLEAEVYNDR